MRRLLVTLLLAHVVASYGVLLAVTVHSGSQGLDVFVIAPVWAPVAVLDVTTDPLRFPRPWQTLLVVDGSYALGFAGTVGLRAWGHWRRVRHARPPKGVCRECGYDLTGNVSGKCPECGTYVNPKARLLVRRLP
jgi:hypothetical protein